MSIHTKGMDVRPGSATRYVRVRVQKVLLKSERGLVVACNGKTRCLPLSQIRDAEALVAGAQNVTLEITEWCAANFLYQGRRMAA